MYVLGIDYGEKNIGLAKSDTDGRMAFSYQTMENNGWENVVNKLREMIREEGIETLVIGLPVSLSGKDSKQTEKVREFVKYVKIHLDLAVILVDERLTSREARRNEPKDIDQDSARIILQAYLDKKIMN